MQTSSPARSYRATLIPKDVNYDEVEFQADKGLLPTIQVQSPSADQAAADAYRVSGKAVHSVVRVN